MPRCEGTRTTPTWAGAGQASRSNAHSGGRIHEVDSYGRGRDGIRVGRGARVRERVRGRRLLAARSVLGGREGAGCTGSALRPRDPVVRRQLSRFGQVRCLARRWRGLGRLRRRLLDPRRHVLDEDQPDAADAMGRLPVGQEPRRAGPGRRSLGLLAPPRDAEVLGRRHLRRPLLRGARVRSRGLVPRQPEQRGDHPAEELIGRGDPRHVHPRQRRPHGHVPSGFRHRARGVDRVRGGAAVGVPHGPRQDGRDPSVDDAPRDAAVRGHLDGFGVHRDVQPWLLGPQPRLRPHGPWRGRLRRRVAVPPDRDERRRPRAPQRARRHDRRPDGLQRTRELGRQGAHGLRRGGAAPALLRVGRRGRRLGHVLPRSLP